MKLEITPWDTAYISQIFPLRKCAYWEISSAYLKAKSGETDEVTIKVNRAKNVTSALYESPLLIHVMIAISIEAISYRGIAAIMPYLNGDELNYIADSFQSLPNSLEALNTSFKLETVFASRLFEPVITGMNPNLSQNQPDMNSSEPQPTLIKRLYTKFWARRQLKFKLALFRDAIAMMETGKLTEASPLADYKDSTILANIAWPNFVSLHDRVLRIQTRRKNIIEALRSEATLSLEDRQVERTYPYDDRRHIHIENGIGCIKIIPSS